MLFTVCTYGRNAHYCWESGILGINYRTSAGGAVNTIRRSDDPLGTSKETATVHDHSTAPPSSNNGRTHFSVFGINYAVDPDTGGVLIPLGGKRHRGLFAIIDAGDLLRVTRHSWIVFKATGDRSVRAPLYARTVIKGKHVYLHRFILGLDDPKIKSDHINHNGLDCRRSNLRVATHQQNMFNRRGALNTSSRFKGVHWNRRVEKWQAQISVGGKVRQVAFFDFEEDAARAYDEWAVVLHGEFACLNFPEEGD